MITDGTTVNLLAGRGIKLTQYGTSIDIGLKFIDMNPGGFPYNDAKATGAASLAIGQNSVADKQQGTAVGWNPMLGRMPLQAAANLMPVSVLSPLAIMLKLL